MIPLRKATASQSVVLGPFVDPTAGTPVTSLTIANTDVKLLKNGAASVNKNSGGATHRANGYYAVTFDATDTSTVGELMATVSVAGALVVGARFTVVEAPVYDRLFAASADANEAQLDQLQASVDALPLPSDIATYLEVHATLPARFAAIPTEPVNAPVWGVSTGDDWLAFLYALGVHRLEQTADNQSLMNSAGTDAIASAFVSDDGTTAVRDKFQ